MVDTSIMRRSRSRSADRDRHELIDIEARLAPYCAAPDAPTEADERVDPETAAVLATTPAAVVAGTPA